MILGGVGSATVMALLLVPPPYRVMAGSSRSRACHERRLERERQQAQEQGGREDGERPQEGPDETG